MVYRPGDTFYLVFTLEDASGATIDADTSITPILTRNGIDDEDLIPTVTVLSAGRYLVTAELPDRYIAGDALAITVTGTIGGDVVNKILYNGIVDRGIDGAQLVPFSDNDPNSVFDCLNAARAAGFGKSRLVGDFLRFYAPDGTTIVAEFAINDIDNPTERIPQ